MSYSDQNQEKRFECSHCGKSFRRRNILQKHLEIHGQPSCTDDDVRFVQCTQCNKKLKTEKSLVRHIIKVHVEIPEKSYECWNCKKSFRRRDVLQKHLFKVHMQPRDSCTNNYTHSLQCEKCKKKFKTRRTLRQHMKAHDENQVYHYECFYCGRSFYRRDVLQRHIFRVHIQPRSTRTKLSSLQCTTCDKKFKTGQTLRQHIKARHGDQDNRYECSSCGKSFRRRDVLQRHIFTMHMQPRTSRIASKETSLQCIICNKNFKTRQTLRQHVKVHDTNRDRNYECSDCGRSFHRRDVLQKHIFRMHMQTGGYDSDFDVKPMPCAKCGKQFGTRKNLRQHLKVHDADREKCYLCWRCGEVFFWKSSLQRHILKIHTEGRTSRSKFNVYPASCAICDKKFKNRKTLRQHMKVHDSSREKRFKCELCSHLFYEKFSYERHKKTYHRKSFEANENIFDVDPFYECWKCAKRTNRKDELRRHIFEMHMEPCRTKYECNNCGAVTYSKRGLESHIWKNCSNIKKICALCRKECRNKAHLLEHYENVHEVNLVRQDFEFATKDDFLIWKKNMENATNSRFIITNQRSNCNSHRTSFICHRSGPPKIKLHNRVRRLKIQGTKKIDGICPAEIILRQLKRDSRCLVSFESTHVGHTLTAKEEIPHMFLENEERKKIASNIQKGIPRSQIIDNYKEDVLSSESLDALIDNANRMAILSNKDVVNIESRFNIRSNVSSRSASSTSYEKNDDRNVDFFINKYAECILYYKSPETPDTKFNILNDEDTMLIFMSPIQKSLLQKYGHRIVAMDEMHSLTSHSGFILHSLMVLDDDDEGFPVAFAFTNRSDTQLIHIFLHCVKEKAGVIAPQIFMTDMQLNYYHSWVKYMNFPERVLFCEWHVTRDWNKHQNLKIKHESKRKRVKVQMDSLRTELDENLFKKKLEDLFRKEDEDTTAFLSYFRQEYLKCTEQWAYCFCQMTGINTNTALKGFQHVVKYINTGGKKLTSIHEGLTLVTDYLQRKLHDTLSKRVKGKLTQKLRELRKAHDQFAKEDVSNIRIEVNDNSSWLVKSFQKNEEMIDVYYIVIKVQDVCPLTSSGDRCNLMCMECGTCAHLYKCTCLQSTMKNTMCKHIHAVASTFDAPDDSDGGIEEFLVPMPVSDQFEVTEEEEEVVVEDDKKKNEKLREDIECLVNEVIQKAKSSDSTDNLEVMRMLLNNAVIAGDAPSSLVSDSEDV